jgi:hypothetical protein
MLKEVRRHSGKIERLRNGLHAAPRIQKEELLADATAAVAWLGPAAFAGAGCGLRAKARKIARITT